MNNIQSPHSKQQPTILLSPNRNDVPGVTYRIQRKSDALPKWLTQYSVIVYFLALTIVSVIYSVYSLPWYYMLAGTVSILTYFVYGSNLVGKTIRIRVEKKFELRILGIAFILRLIWMFIIYAIFMQQYGDAFGFENMDATFYHDIGRDFALAIRNDNFWKVWQETTERIDVSDLGYGLYVSLVYLLTDDSIIAVRLLKCVWSSLTVLLIYRLSKRNYDDQTARVAAIFCALWPNFWYYCGTHLKETEMVFLAVLFVEQADQMLRSQQFTAWKVIPVLLIGASLLTLRTPLAIVALTSLIFSVVMSSSRVVSWGKRIIVGALAILLIGVTMGERIQKEAQGLFNTANSSFQKSNMEWRGTREHGNSFAKYAGSVVFAPLIFTIPFPSMVRPYEGQEEQQLLNGGNFVKNIVSFFTIFAMILLLTSGKWRNHLLPLSFLLGYLVVLTMSEFAHSERFHQPAIPFEFMFAAYGVSFAVSRQKYKRWFTYWCIVMLLACIAWNWFKLAGRGLI